MGVEDGEEVAQGEGLGGVSAWGLGRLGGGQLAAAVLASRLVEGGGDDAPRYSRPRSGAGAGPRAVGRADRRTLGAAPSSTGTTTTNGIGDNHQPQWNEVNDMTDPRRDPGRRHAAAVAAAAVLVLAGCASGASDAGRDRSEAPVSGATPAASTTAPPAPTVTSEPTGEPTHDAVEVRLEVREGRVFPPTHRVKIQAGHRVRLLVISDTADEVHVHGYDHRVDVQPGIQAVVEFVADQSGLFEVELEEAGLQLVQLEVR